MMHQYRIRLEIIGGPLGYHYTDLYFSKWYPTTEKLKKEYISDIGDIEKEIYERTRTLFLEETSLIYNIYS